MGILKEIIEEKQKGKSLTEINIEKPQANRRILDTELRDPVPVKQVPLGDLIRDAYERPYVRNATFKDMTVNSFKRGFDNSKNGVEWYKAMSGQKNNADEYTRYMDQNPNYKFQTNGWLGKALSGAMEQLGQQYYQSTAPETLAYTGTAAGAALAAGNLSPLAVFPEEIVTVPAAIATGQALGSTKINYEIETGNAYQEMIENGIDKNLAAKIATGVGLTNAALEGLQLDDLVKSWKVLNKINPESSAAKQVAKYIADRAVHTANETLQETLQEGSTIIGSQFASERQNGEWQYNKDEVKDRLKDTAISSAVTFGLMGLSGDAVNYGINRSERSYINSRNIQELNEIGKGINNTVGSKVVKPLLKGASDKKISKYLDNLEYWNEQIQKRSGESAQRENNIQERTPAFGNYTNTYNTEPIGRTQTQNSQSGAVTSGIQQTPRQTAPTNSVEWGRKFGENGQKAFMTNIKQDTNVDEYGQAFARYYDMGAAKVPFEKVENNMRENVYGNVLSEDQKYAAYTSGINDAAAALKKESERIKFVKYYTDDAGVVENEHIRGMSQEDIHSIDRLAKAVGSQVVFTDSIDSGKINGFIENGKINIARDAENPYGVVAAHEVTHRMQEIAPAEYRAYRDFVVSQNSEAVERYGSRLAEMGYYLTDNQIMDEIAADYTGKILKDADSINRFMDNAENGKLNTKMSVSENMTVAQKLWQSVRDFIDKVKSVFKGDKNAQNRESRKAYGKNITELEKAEQLLRNAYTAAAERTKKAEKVQNAEKIKTGDKTAIRYSLVGTTEDGRKIYKTNYADNTPKATKQQDIINLVQEVWSKRDIVLTVVKDGKANSITVKFDPTLSERSDLSKIAFGNRKGTASEKRMTLDLSSDLYQIAKDAVHTASKKEIGKDNPAHTGVYNWEYFITNLVYRDNNGNNIDCYMNIDVKQKANGNYFYSFAIEKGVAPQTLLAVVAEHSSATTPSADSISQSNTSVNTQYTQNTENNAQSITNIKSDDKKYSIKYTKDNQPVVCIEDNILEGVDKKDWVKTVKDIIHKRFSQGIPIQGRLVKVKAITEKEFTNSRYSGYLKRNNTTVYEDKFKSGGQLDEIIIASRNYINEDLNHTRKDNIEQFARGDVLLRVGNNDYEAKVIIGITGGNNMILYDVIDFTPTTIALKKESYPRKRRDSGTLSLGMTTENNISQNNNSVNTQYTQNTENNAQSITKNDIQNNRQNSVKNTEDILRQNEVLKKYTLKLRDELHRLKKGNSAYFIEKNIKNAASDILNEADFAYDKTKFADELCGLARDTQSIIKGKMTFEDFRRKVGTLAKDVIEEGLRNDTVEYEETKGLRNYLRTTAIKLSDSERANLGDEYNTIRKETFGRLRLTKEGTDIGTVYRELSLLYPEFFNEETETNASAQLHQIRDVLNHLKTLNENPYSGYMNEATEWLSNVIIDRIYNEGFVSGNNAVKVTVDTGELRKNAMFTLQDILNSERKWREREYNKMKKRFDTKEAKYSERRERSLRVKQIRLHTERLSKALINPSEKFAVPEFLRQPVAGLLKHINLTTDKMGEKQRTRLTDLANAYAAINKERADKNLVWDKDLQDELFDAAAEIEKLGLEDAQISDLPLDVLETVRRVIVSAETEIRNYNKAFRMGKYQTIDVLSNKVYDDITGKKRNDYRTNKIKPVEWGRSTLEYSMLNPWDFFHQFGPSAENMYNALRSGMNENTNRMNTAVEYMDKIKEKYGVSDNEISGKRAKIYTFKTAGGEEIQLNRGQMMSLYCLARQKAGMTHMTEGGICIADEARGLKEMIIDEKGNSEKKIKFTKKENYNAIHLTTEDIGKVISALSDKEKKFAAAVSDFFSTVCADWGNETSLELYGYKKYNAKNYFPIKSARDYLDEQYGVKKDSRIKNQSHTNSRIKGANNPIMIINIMDVYANHTSDIVNYSTLVLPIEDAARIMNYRELDGSKNIRALIETKYGVGATEYFSKLMTDLNGGMKSESGSKFLNKMVSNYKGAKMGANVRVVIQQPLSYLRAAALIDGKYLAGAYTQKTDLETMYKYAPISRWKDWGFFELDHGKNMRELISGKKSLSDYTMYAAGKADQLTWKKIWAAVELETADKHPELTRGSKAFYEACGKRFDEIIDRTQVVDSTLHRSQALRSSNSLVKMTYSFMSEPLKTYNLLKTSAIDAMHGGANEKKAFARTAVVCAASFVLTAAVNGAYDTWVDDDDEDKDGSKRKFIDRWLENSVDNLIGDILGMFPFAKDVYSMIRGYSSKRMDMQLTGDFINAARRCASNEYTPAYKISNLLARGAELFGVPAMAFRKTVYDTFIKKIISGYKDPWLEYNVAKQFYVVSGGKNKKIYDDILEDMLEYGDISRGKKIVDDMKRNGTEQDDISKRLLDVRSDDVFEMWKSGKQSEYERAVSDLMKLGVDADKIEKRMTSRYNEYKKSDDFKKDAGFSVPWRLKNETSGKSSGEDKYDVSNLSESQYKKYTNISRRLENEVVDEVKRSGGTEKQINAAYEYVKQTALEEASNGEYEAIYEWINQAQYAADMWGTDIATIIYLKDIISDKDDDGNTITTKKEKVIDYLNESDLTQDEYDYLYYNVMGYKK